MARMMIVMAKQFKSAGWYLAPKADSAFVEMRFCYGLRIMIVILVTLQK